MATYAIGDIQGCADEFDDLLNQIGIGAQDEVWLVGDLVNRGPKSAQVLERALSLEGQVRTVLGNHDLHLLAVHFAGHRLSRSDTMHDALAHKRMDEFAQWLCEQPLLYTDEQLGWTMSHAGIPHMWSLEQAHQFANEVSLVLRDRSDVLSREDFFANMYGNTPDCWADSLEGLARIKLITNYFTRMRLMRADGQLDFKHKGTLDDRPAGWEPWYQFAASQQLLGRFVFGHWAALDGMTPLPHIHAIDSGCVYGRELTALRLEDGVRFKVPARSAYSA